MSGFALMLLVGGGLVLLAGGIVASIEDRRRAEATAYLRPATLGRPIALDAFASRLSEPFVRRVLGPIVDRSVGAATRISPAEHRVAIERQIVAAGLDGRWSAADVMAAEVLGAGAGLLGGLVLLGTERLTPWLAVVCAVVMVLVGYLAPRAVLARRVRERLDTIREDLADGLDLLAISVEAGVGLEAAMAVVSERMRSPLADELARTLQELGLGLSRSDALANLKARCPVPELGRFAQALIQADQLGTPIGDVLKMQAEDQRSRQRQWARETSAKLPVKILFPLAVCIFPAVLVVVLGPAIATIGDAL